MVVSFCKVDFLEDWNNAGGMLCLGGTTSKVLDLRSRVREFDLVRYCCAT